MRLIPTSFTAVILVLSIAVGTGSATAGTSEELKSTAPLQQLLMIEPGTSVTRASEGDIAELSDGRLALVYSKFSGHNQDHAPAHLAMRTSVDKGKTWSEDRELVANEGGRNVMSVSLINGKLSNELLLFYLRKDSEKTSCTMLVRRSTDNLETLSEPVVVTLLPGYHVVNNARVIRLKSGRLLVPAALHTDMESVNTTAPMFAYSAALTAYYSDDDGHTWHRDNSRITPIAERSIVFHEPGLVELSDGRIMMYIRTDQGSQYVQYSSDEGINWTKPEPMPLASPISPATIERIPRTGTLAAVWNDHSGRWPYKPKLRTPLCIAFSHDEGKTWGPSELLEGDPNGWYCYTSMTFVDDSLLLSYCAGQGQKHGLDRLKVAKLPLSWLSSVSMK